MPPLRHSLALLLACLSTQAAAEETILQYFNTSWSEIERRLPELAEAGYTSLWLPPPHKGSSGGFSVGYDPVDRFDLGDKNQSGSVPTKYGTRADLLSLTRAAHRFGLKVYFDNVMAHTAGPLDPVDPGTLLPGVPGFVPEDFHLVRNPDGSWRKASDSVDYNDEWQVLNRNPFAWDIAQEDPNTSFDATGPNEGTTQPKWRGIRHPGQSHLYLDHDLTVATDAHGIDVHPFSNKEPYTDENANGRFDFTDTNANGQHDPGEPSEPFADTGVDPTNPFRRTTHWGFGNGRYDMGDPVPEDVNQLLFRSVRWFIDTTHADGFRLDAVKHVPSYFFGEQNAADKDRSGAGFLGAIQTQHNITRGLTDWDNHRNSVYTNTLDRDDALLFGEHLGAPPAVDGYLQAGMRIANDDFLNGVSSSIGNSLANFDQPNHLTFGNTGQAAAYALSHDNNSPFGGDRPSIFRYLLAREGLPIVYTDGYNHSTDHFPKQADAPFLGQFGADWITTPLRIRRDFVRGSQNPRWQDQDFAAWEFHDRREHGNNNPASYVTALVMIARNYTGQDSTGRDVTTSFPPGARLRNYGDNGAFHVTVNGDGKLRDGFNAAPSVPRGGIFAFSWDTPRHTRALSGSPTRPITILQNGQPTPTMQVARTDGRDGDSDYDHTVTVPRITDLTDLSFIARADGSAADILIKLDGGIDVNSHLGLGRQGIEKRDNPPPLNGIPNTDIFTGYEKMTFVDRTAEKFAARSVSRNTTGSRNAENWSTALGSRTITREDGEDFSTPTGAVTWVYHNPDDTTDRNAPQFSYTPANRTLTLWVKIGYGDEPDDAFLYYTTDGTEPQGSLGAPGNKTSTATFRRSFNAPHDGTGTASWWRATLTDLPPSSPFRYKIGVHRNNADPRFPFSERDVELKRRMQSVYAITGFNGETVTHFPHNDHGSRATGLAEGFHILRTRAFLGRASNETSIFHTEAQTFYVDAHPPAGQFAFPRPGDTVGPDSYGAVVLADATTTAVEFRILHSDPASHQPWQPAARTSNPTQLGTTDLAQEWRFDYTNIPASGTATIEVRLTEQSGNAQIIQQHVVTNTAPLNIPALTITHNPGGSLAVSFPALPTQTYTLQASPDLESWSDASAPFTPTAATTHSFPVPSPGSPTHLRLHLSR